MFISTNNQSKSNMIEKMKILKNNNISKALLKPILKVKNNIKNRRQRLLDTFLSNIIEGNLVLKLKYIGQICYRCTFPFIKQNFDDKRL